MKYNVIKIVRAVEIIKEKPLLEGKIGFENWIHGLGMKFGYENWKIQPMISEELI